MEKIKLKSGKEFDVVNIEQQGEDKLRFTVKGVSDYTDFKSQLNKQSLSEVKVYTGKTLVADYGSFKQVDYPLGITEEEDGTMSVTVTIRRENETEARISALEDAVDTLILTNLGAI